MLNMLCFGWDMLRTAVFHFLWCTAKLSGFYTSFECCYIFSWRFWKLLLCFFFLLANSIFIISNLGSFINNIFEMQTFFLFLFFWKCKMFIFFVFTHTTTAAHVTWNTNTTTKDSISHNAPLTKSRSPDFWLGSGEHKHTHTHTTYIRTRCQSLPLFTCVYACLSLIKCACKSIHIVLLSLKVAFIYISPIFLYATAPNELETPFHLWHIELIYTACILLSGPWCHWVSTAIFVPIPLFSAATFCIQKQFGNSDFRLSSKQQAQ